MCLFVVPIVVGKSDEALGVDNLKRVEITSVDKGLKGNKETGRKG